MLAGIICKFLWKLSFPLTPPLSAVQSQKKTTGSVYDSPRAMAKLLKEAKRVKQVLSANNDHRAQVRGRGYEKAVVKTVLV